MARRVTLTFADGTSHAYEGVPDDATPREVQDRAAREFPDRKLVNIDGGRSAPIPGQEGEAGRAAAARAAPAPTIAQRAVGAAETGLTLATGATGGAVGMIGGTLKGLAEQILSGNFGTPQAAALVEKSAAAGADALTYSPRTPAGQEMAAAAGQALQELVPIAGVMPAMAGPAGASARAPARVTARAAVEGSARDVAGPAGAAVAAKAVDRVAALPREITSLPRRALEKLRTAEEPAATPGTMGSVGAAGTDMAAQRRATAESLGFVGDKALTRGQATRDAAQLKFEVETAKMPEQGVALRQRVINQNEQALNWFDHAVDQAGGRAPNLRAVGETVDAALVKKYKADADQVRAAYRAAEKAGEMEDPVTLASVVDHLNESGPDTATAPLLDVARRRAIRTGIAVEGPDGNLVPQPVTLRIAETYRQAIGQATDYAPTNIRQATIIKGLVDEATTGLGGNGYKLARKERQRLAQNYEDRATISKLLNNKRGTADRQVAFEDVFQHSVLKASLDDVRNVRRVLQRGGAEGQQAWRELQSATASWIRDEATKNIATDSAGNRVLSPAALDKAVRTLDVDGRLDFIFGKRGAQQMRDINELMQVSKTVPPEAAINTSNTATTLMAGFIDVGGAGLTGVPVPLATSYRLVRQYVKDRELRRRIEEALNDQAKRRAPGRRMPSQAPPPGATLQ